MVAANLISEPAAEPADTGAFVDALEHLEHVYVETPEELERVRSLAALDTRRALPEFARLPRELQAALAALLSVSDETKELALRIVNLPSGAREPLQHLLGCTGPAQPSFSMFDRKFGHGRG